MVVPVEVQEDEELYVRLRNKFLEDLEDNGNYDDYEQCDVDRIRTDDHYCKRFILQKKGNLGNALDMAHEALKWRKSFGVKNVTQESIPLEFFQAKAVYPFNKDKEGNPIILILVRFHRKVPEFIRELRRFVIYWVELMEEQTNGGQMTVIMSCAGAGLSNLDLDLIKFLITLFRSYYPYSLAHILIYDMPWILHPAWKIIKAWLPEDFVEKIKFVNKISIQEYISEDNLPLEMGGTDETEYEPPAFNDINSNSISSAENEQKRGISSNEVSSVVITDDFTIIGGILKISPAVHLNFSPPHQETKDVYITLTCVAETPISYKVKTNNIESYRVKPSIGIIEPGNSIRINVILLPGFHPLPTDKFLIMAMEIDDPMISVANLSNLWKTSPPAVIADHKLKCVYQTAVERTETEMEVTLKSINSTLKNFELKMQMLDTRLASVQIKQTMCLIAVLFLGLIFLGHLILSDCQPAPALNL